jgi:hypothetical protein
VSKRTRIALLVSFALVAAGVASHFTADSQADFMGSLNANVGPGSTISLSTPEGALVTSLGPGTYDIHVTDQATNHNFHLEGPGVNIATSIDIVETVDWTVEFTDASYTYRCDRHASLNGGFVAGNPQALVAPTPAPVAPVPALTPVPAPAPAPVPAVASTPTTTPTASGGMIAAERANTALLGTVKVSLTAKDDLIVTVGGKAVSKLAAGRYKLVVADGSARRDVSLRRIADTPRQLTSRGFTGTRSTTVDLTSGQWKLYSAANEQGVFSFFRVTK